MQNVPEVVSIIVSITPSNFLSSIIVLVNLFIGIVTIKATTVTYNTIGYHMTLNAIFSVVICGKRNLEDNMEGNQIYIISRFSTQMSVFVHPGI
jgi:hypothetical protein